MFCFVYTAKLGISGDVSGQIQTPASNNKTALPAPPEQEPVHVDHSAEIAAQTEQIRKDYEEKLANLQRMYEEEQTGKQKLQESLHSLQDEYNKKLEQVQQKYSADDEVSQSEEIVNKFQAQDDSHATTDVNQNEVILSLYAMFLSKASGLFSVPLECQELFVTRNRIWKRFC